MTNEIATTPRHAADVSLEDLQAMQPDRGDRAQYEPAPEGWQPARFVDVIDAGESQFNEDSEPRRQFRFILAVPTRMVDGEGNDLGPRLVSHWVGTSLWPGGEGTSISNHLKMLREVFDRPNLLEEDLRGKYTLGKMIGRPTAINVIHQKGAKGFTRGKVVKFRRATAEDDQAAPGLDQYTRPEWLAKAEAKATSAMRKRADNSDVFAPAAPAPAPAPTPAPAPAPEPETLSQVVAKSKAAAAEQAAGYSAPASGPRTADEADIPF